MRLIDFFDRGCSRYPERAFASDGCAEFTYREAQDLSHQIVNGLLAAGLKPGRSVVAVLSPNDSRAFVGILGALRSFVWLPLNARNTMADNIAIMAANDCEWIFYHSDFAEFPTLIEAGKSAVKGRVCIDKTLSGDPCMRDWASEYPTTSPYLPQKPDDVSVIWPTGGTTGLSKGVLTTHLNWETMIASLLVAMPYSEPPTHLVAAPMTHAAGVIIFALMSLGVTNVFMPSADPREIAQNIARYRVTTLFLPPTAIYSMLALPTVGEFDYASLKYFIYAAAPMSEDKLKLAIDTFGPVMAQTFGQAESPMICCFLSPAEHLPLHSGDSRRRLSSCGRPSAFTEVEIMDESGNILDVEQKGEIVVRGNLVTLGYNKAPEATAEVRKFGWHHTNDIGFKDADGYVYISDRKRDMIISGGFNIYPSEIEQVIWSHPAVQDCAVVGVPDDRWGEAVKAVIQLKPGMSATGEDILKFLRPRLGGMKCPKSIDIWEDLPRSAVGKVLKKDIRAVFWAGQNRSI